MTDRNRTTTRHETHQRFPTTSASDPAKTLEFAVAAARLLADNHCEDVVLLNVSGLSQVSDYLVIASGTSDRQMRSSAEDAAELGAKMDSPAFRTNVDERATWIVVDFVDVVLHIFEPNTRAHYDLEMLWEDAPRVAWERPDQVSRNRAGVE